MQTANLNPGIKKEIDLNFRHSLTKDLLLFAIIFTFMIPIEIR